MPDVLRNGLIYPDWPVPEHVKSVMTTREGGVSQVPFDSMNLGDHVEDSPAAVAKNRALLHKRCGLPAEPMWLTQVHGTTVVMHTGAANNVVGDAIIAHDAGQVCAVMTADCLPVLFCNMQGTAVAAAHAGWRGLEAGILESTIAGMQCQPDELLVWLGAAIGFEQFEVGGEVREAFLSTDSKSDEAFKAHGKGKWLADLYALTRLRLEGVGIRQSHVFGGEWCTYTQSNLFYSYRRESRTGRMASLIWLE